MEFGIASVAAITVVCYLIGMVVKSIPRVQDKYIPIACGVCGAVLGPVALHLGLADFPAADDLTAVAVGIVSGLAATGVNQIGKQIIGCKEQE